jgi:DNA-binding CsgD family transcriptional regulator/PAS domain-containing protein
MLDAQLGVLTETIYDAAVEPARWADVMGLFRRAFSTGAEGFYFLDFGQRALRPVQIAGIGDSYLRSFRECFYTKDNPCTRSGPLHRPGVIRTDERLAAFFGDPHILQRSQYYNEWMRPQDFAHTMGTTLLAEGDTILNLTLLRPAGVGAFGEGEAADFTQVCRHLQRAMRLAMRIETITTRRAMTDEALEHLNHGIAFLGLDGRVLHCNRSAEALLRAGDALTSRNGRLAAVDAAAQKELLSLLNVVALGAWGGIATPHNITVPRRGGARPLVLSAIRLSSVRAGLVMQRPTILVTIVDGARAQPTDLALLRSLYGLTQGEARFARNLAAAGSLRQAAEATGISYETARWYVKILFQKTGTRRQAELVGRLLGDLSLPLRARH